MSNSEKDYIILDDEELFEIPEEIEKEFKRIDKKKKD